MEFRSPMQLGRTGVCSQPSRVGSHFPSPLSFSPQLPPAVTLWVIPGSHHGINRIDLQAKFTDRMGAAGKGDGRNPWDAVVQTAGWLAAKKRRVKSEPRNR
jgi:hypothetical protein